MQETQIIKQRTQSRKKHNVRKYLENKNEAEAIHSFDQRPKQEQRARLGKTQDHHEKAWNPREDLPKPIHTMYHHRQAGLQCQSDSYRLPSDGLALFRKKIKDAYQKKDAQYTAKMIQVHVLILERWGSGSGANVPRIYDDFG